MSFISGEARSNVLVSMLHMSKGIISCIGAVCMCMVFGIDSHARIDAISTLPEDGGKADPESVPDALCPHEAPMIFADEPTASLDARTRKTVANISLGRRHMAHPSSSSSECYPRRMQPVSESFTWVTWDVVAIVPAMSQSPTQPERCTAATISDSAG